MEAPSFMASKTFIAMQKLLVNTLNWSKIKVTCVRMSNARLQLDMDFVPLWKQKYAEQIEFTFMWINIQNSSGALVITIWPLDPSFEQRGEFQIFELTGMELCVYIWRTLIQKVFPVFLCPTY